MKILVIGSGGREHALVWKLAQSKNAGKIYCAPGNAGIAGQAECVDIKAEDVKGLLSFALKNKIDLTVTGPEQPLVSGIVDEFNRHGLKIFGPVKNAARLEGSKIFSKKLMWKYNIPTANGEIFNNCAEAVKYLNKVIMPVVVKADGLAAGKGVIICKTRDEAVNAVKMIMEKRVFGDSGSNIIIEECLIGEEVSILAISDGSYVIPLVPAQDHKRIFDDDKGPNTGGMGAYSPVPFASDDFGKKIKEKILQPVVDAMKREGDPYKGILYAGLMITKNGPKVLEFNVRFGDPETQVILPRMQSDLLSHLAASVEGSLEKERVVWNKQSCVCVVIASGGYPDKYEKGFPIEGLDGINDGIVFHAGTQNSNGRFVTSGGRVLGVSALGDTIQEAAEKCYKIISKIKFKNMYYRKDIAVKSK